MVILKNGIKSVTHRFFSGRTLKMRDIWNKFGTPGHFIKKRDCPGKNGTNGNPTLVQEEPPPCGVQITSGMSVCCSKQA
jgi:hypothetical protein